MKKKQEKRQNKKSQRNIFMNNNIKLKRDEINMITTLLRSVQTCFFFSELFDLSSYRINPPFSRMHII